MKKRFLIIAALICMLLCAFGFAACEIPGDDALYSVSVSETAGGTLTPDKTEAKAGETVTVIATPDEGYTFEEGSLTVNGAKQSGMSFTMPARKVKLSATFKPLFETVDVSAVTFSDLTVEYDKTEKKIEAASLPEGVSVTYQTNTLLNAGEVTAKATLSAEGKKLMKDGKISDAVELTAKLTVTPKEIEGAVKGAPLLATGEILEVEIEFTGVLEGDEVEYTVVTEPEEVKEAGPYTATVTLQNGNYKLKAAEIPFEVAALTQLEKPSVTYNNGQLLFVQTDENATAIAYSFDNLAWETTEESTLDVKGVGKRTVFVKAISDSAAFGDSEVVECEYFMEGSLVKYDFSAVEQGVVKDLSGNGNDLVLRNSYAVTDDKAVKLDNTITESTLAYAADQSYMESESMTVEAVAKFDKLKLVNDSWNTLVYKQNEYFIGFWYGQQDIHPGAIRLVMWLSYEGQIDWNGTAFDNTNFWIPIANVQDGNYHQFAMTYDKNAGAVRYFMDYAEVPVVTGVRPVKPGVAHHYGAGLPIVLGAWGNMYDIENTAFNYTSELTLAYFEVRNYAVGNESLGEFYERTGKAIAESKTQLQDSGNASYWQAYLDHDEKPMYGSMCFTITFSIVDEDMDYKRYTLAYRDLGFHLILLKDRPAEKYFMQCYFYTTGYRDSRWGAAAGQAGNFLDLGSIPDALRDGKEHTVSVSFDAITGLAMARFDDIHENWMENQFGGQLVNAPVEVPSNKFPLVIGGASFNTIEKLPSSAKIASFSLTDNPNDIILS